MIVYWSKLNKDLLMATRPRTLKIPRGLLTLSSCQAWLMVTDDAQLEGCGALGSSTPSVSATAGASRSSPVRPASRASPADRYKQVLPVPCARTSDATSSDGVSWCTLEAHESRAAAVLENLIAVRISTASKHRWQPGARARPRLSWQSKII